MTKFEKSTSAKKTKSEKSPVTEKTATIDEITTTLTSSTSSGNNVVFDKLHLCQNG